MPRYVIERQYLVPVYEHILVEAVNFEKACLRALDESEEPWGDDAKADYESARPTTIVCAVEVPEPMDLSADSLSYLLYTAGLDPLDVPAKFSQEVVEADPPVGFV